MLVKNKTVVITGGSSGLGLALAKAYVRQGANIALLARNKDKLAAALAELRSINGNTQLAIYPVDICNYDSLDKVVRHIVEDFGSLDILINSAGILFEAYVEKTDMDVFESINQTNYLALVAMTKLCLPHLKQAKGHIVNIASMASFFGTFGYTAYSASKFAVLGFSEALRFELRPQGVKVHVICPPEFAGPMVDGISEGRSPENKYLVQTAGSLSVNQVLKETLQGLQKDKFIILVGRSAKAAALMNRLFPALVRYFLDASIKRIYRGPDAR